MQILVYLDLIKKIMKQSFFLLLILFYSASPYASSVITSESWSGRFGDQLYLYAKTKWLAIKFNIQFFYKPFTYSNRLVLHNHEKQYSQEIEDRFRNKVEVKNEDDISKIEEGIKSKQIISTLYKCHFINTKIFPDFSTLPKGAPYHGLYSNFYEIVVQNPLFKKFLRELMQPLNPSSILKLPTDRMTVALHIRTGGEFETPLSIDRQKRSEEPFKYPPMQYYIDQLKKLHELLDYRSLYVFIFTDDSDPKKLVSNIVEQYDHPNLTFACRESGNRYDLNVVEDFWEMTKFDCIIRGFSSYSIMAQCLGDPKIIIEPWSFKWHQAKLIMGNIMIILPHYEKKCVTYFPFELSNQELKIMLHDIFRNWLSKDLE